MKRWIIFVLILTVFLSVVVISFNKSNIPRARRNNNPLNVKYGGTTKKWVDNSLAILDPIPAADGGYFLKFNTVKDGWRAATDLLTSNIYADLSIDAALRKWSGGGYGGEIVPLSPTKKIKHLDEEKLRKLMRAMVRREGYF